MIMGTDYRKLCLELFGTDNEEQLQIIEKTQGRMAEDKQWIKIRYIT